MDTLNLRVIRAACEWSEQKSRFFFITVISTWGASPRPAGSLIAYNLDHETQVGSLSGGCVEDDLFDYLKTHFKTVNNPPSYLLKKYGANAEEHTRYLLPCGGTVELLIEPIFDSSAYDHFIALRSALLKRQPIARSLYLSENAFKRSVCQNTMHHSKSVELSFDADSSHLLHRLDPAFNLLLIGLGDVTVFLSSFAETLGFDVTICEPRTEYLKRFQQDNLPYKICRELPDDLIKRRFSDSFCAVLCLAHDPKLDDMALMEALVSSGAFYIGAMGSFKTSQARVDRLRSLGMTKAQLKRLHAPIGLDIHSKTPQEIAIAISAELIAVRHMQKAMLIDDSR